MYEEKKISTDTDFFFRNHLHTSPNYFYGSKIKATLSMLEQVCKC